MPMASTVTKSGINIARKSFKGAICLVFTLFQIYLVVLRFSLFDAIIWICVYFCPGFCVRRLGERVGPS